MLCLAVFPAAVYAVDVDSLDIVPKEMVGWGWSADIAISPVDGGIHMIWAADGRLLYMNRMPGSDTWSDSVFIDIGGLYVLGVDEKDGFKRRHCTALTVGEDGVVHIVFSVRPGGSMYYLYGGPGNWSAPLEIAHKGDSSIFPDIVELNGDLHVVFEDSDDLGVIFYVSRINGIWQEYSPVEGDAGSPDLAVGDNGMLYCAYRTSWSGSPLLHNTLYSYKIPGFTEWINVGMVTNVPYEQRGCKGASLMVYHGDIYMAWALSTREAFDPGKGEVYCGKATEPGLEWDPRFGSQDPILASDSGEPYPGIEVFSDGSLILFFGKVGRSVPSNPMFTIYSDGRWKSPRNAPWDSGLAESCTDGRTVWVVSSDTEDHDNAYHIVRQIWVGAITNPYAVAVDYSNQYKPVFVSEPDTAANTGGFWTYAPRATDGDMDDVTYSLVLAPETMTLNDNVISWSPGVNDTNFVHHERIGEKDRYLIGVKADDGRGKFNTQYFWLWVYEMPFSADFSALPVQGLKPLTVQFTDLSDGQIETWSWDFGDGHSGNVQHPAHTYQDAGTFSVTLTIAGAGGNAVRTRQDYINVTEPPPVAQFQADPVSGEAPLSVQFSDLSTGAVTSWLWDFGDNTSGADQHPEHTYSDTGRYTIRLTVTGPGGTDFEEKENYITIIEIPLDADFIAIPVSGYPPLTVQFTDQSTGKITGRDWYFGDTYTDDGGRSTLMDPSYTYTQPGFYSVMLTITGSQGQDAELKHNFIEVLSDTTAVSGRSRLPGEFMLGQNFPNPFNMKTTIPYGLPDAAFVRIDVFDTAGKWINTLEARSRPAGYHDVIWQGYDSRGHTVVSGTYIVRLQAAGHVSRRKVLLLK